MTIIFYRYENGILTKNDGWYDYNRELVIDRINKQNENIEYKALIRGTNADFNDMWHELDLTKSELYKRKSKQLSLF